jgi:hypothetical protein
MLMTAAAGTVDVGAGVLTAGCRLTYYAHGHTDLDGAAVLPLRSRLHSIRNSDVGVFNALMTMGVTGAFFIYALLLYGFVELLGGDRKLEALGTVRAAVDSIWWRRMGRVGASRVVESSGAVRRSWPCAHGACSGLACAGSAAMTRTPGAS